MPNISELILMRLRTFSSCYGPADQLSVVTGSVRAQPLGVAQIGVMQRLLGWHLRLHQHPNAAG
jgi:hypothetical protein